MLRSSIARISELLEPRQSLLRSNADVEAGISVIRPAATVEAEPSDPVLKFAGGLLVVASLAFFFTVLQIARVDPDYFDQRYIIQAEKKQELDPIVTGATERLDAGVMPVPEVVRVREPQPQDFAVVMVFEDEALLATSRELWRVKVGSVVPGLGKVEKIEANGTGGTIVTERAVLALEIDDKKPQASANAD
ncbi:hypothetical protein [Consotaella aegiceratis]|uniref:hypothetical protein n=1 Tax=Consotaella aegiceratis TaxID=3097961 RepID=UPI002F4261A1